MLFRINDSETAAKAVNMHTVSHFKHMWHVMADQHNRQTARFHVLNQVQNAARFTHTQSSRWLIHNDDTTAKGGGTRNGYTLTLTP